jgi:uncharacterized protein (TIGR02588 family)
VSDAQQEKKGRTAPEWITFAVSLLLLAGLVGLIARDMVEEERPANPTAAISGEPRRLGDQFIVTVEVENKGDLAALSVQVKTELTIGDEVIDGDQVVDFLAGSATEEVEVVLPRNPGDGELTARVTGFQHP